MNERIRELAEQAGIVTEVWKTDSLGHGYKVPNYEAEKFAELIVRDMLRLLEQYTQDSFPKDILDEFDRGYLAGLYTAQKAVKKHFGIK